MAYSLQQTPTGGIGFIDEASSAKGACVMCLPVTVARGATNTVTVGTLPANARLIDIEILVTVVSNAATTATVSVGLAGGSNTYFTAAQDVKTAIGNFRPTPTANWTVSASSRDLSVTYTETGAASSAGTFYVNILYCVL